MPAIIITVTILTNKNVDI